MVDLTYVQNNIREGWQLNPNEKVVNAIIKELIDAKENVRVITILKKRSVHVPDIALTINVIVHYMLKYSNYEIVFAEVPDEISLAINLTNCPHTCINCHSPWLREDNGTSLTYVELTKLIKQNTGISCVCFMGGDREPWEVVRLAKLIREDFPNLKTAWYSGSESVDHQNQFNYVKTGPYIESFGPLNSKTTNQRMVEYNLSTELGPSWYMRDITYKFWKNDN